MIFPTRAENLNSLESLDRDWEKMKLAIRQECRDDILIEKAKTAFKVELFDSSINYFWNMVIHDLHKKIMYYGIDYFASAINWEGNRLRNESNLREVRDYEIISGCYSLGIIGHEAHFFLNQCREIRNNFSTAHYAIGDLDKIEATNFIKNCVKYVLTFDPPSPGLQIKDLIEAMKLETWNDSEEFKALLMGQSPKIYPTILHNFFSNFIKNDCEYNLKHNIKIAAPIAWEMVDDEVRTTIALRYASLKDRPTKDAAAEAFEFLKIVKGIEYIPETFKEIIYRKHSKNLINAHMEFKNFYSEPLHAEELLSLGTNEIPLSTISLYTKAITLSFIGNYYGIARNAQVYNTQMIASLSQAGIRTLFKIIKEDLDVIRELTNHKPIERLKELMEIIKGKTMFADQKKDFEYYLNTPIEKLKDYFYRLYWEKVRKQ